MSGRRAATAARSAETAADSSRVRAGASPSQNGMVGGAPAAPGRHAVGQHVEDGVEVGALEPAERVRPPDERPELLDLQVAGRDRRHALLGQDVERVLGHAERVQLSRPDGAHRGRGLHQVVARQGEDDALRHPPARVARAADALDERRERARRAHVADEVDGAHVDAQL